MHKFLQLCLFSVFVLAFSCNPVEEEIEEENCEAGDITLKVVDASGNPYANLGLHLLRKPLIDTIDFSYGVGTGTTDSLGEVRFSNIGCGQFYITNKSRNFSEPFLLYKRLIDKPSGMFTKISSSQSEFEIVLRKIVATNGRDETSPFGSISYKHMSKGFYDSQVTLNSSFRRYGPDVATSTRFIAQRFVPSAQVNACGIGLGVTYSSNINRVPFQMNFHIYDEAGGVPGNQLRSSSIHLAPASYAATSYNGVGALIDFCIENTNSSLTLNSGTAYWLVSEIPSGENHLGLQYHTAAENTQASNFFALQSDDASTWNAIYDMFQASVSGSYYNVPSSTTSYAIRDSYISSPGTFVGDKPIITIFVVE